MTDEVMNIKQFGAEIVLVRRIEDDEYLHIRVSGARLFSTKFSAVRIDGIESAVLPHETGGKGRIGRI